MGVTENREREKTSERDYELYLICKRGYGL